ncbi:transposase [Nonomuraea sp. H19]|uniref:transposase n=1 Tax=Nonomuraea sp. H19 TaxID=3452206 RepID=UPI003F8C2B4B
MPGCRGGPRWRPPWRPVVARGWRSGAARPARPGRSGGGPRRARRCPRRGLRSRPPRRAQGPPRLFRFYDRCAASDLPELERLATTIETWWPEILAFIRTGITNAGSEGTNRAIKTTARDAYGFRNPENQRLRTRCATTRRGRGYLNPA